MEDGVFFCYLLFDLGEIAEICDLGASDQDFGGGCLLKCPFDVVISGGEDVPCPELR